MTIPTLKRVKVSSEQELRNWLGKQSNGPQTVMIVTCDKTSKTKHVSADQIKGAVTDHGWAQGRSYTLNGNLMGHVIHHMT